MLRVCQNRGSVMQSAHDILIHMVSCDEINKTSLRYWILRLFILGYYDELTLELAERIQIHMLPHMKMLRDICNDIRGFRPFLKKLQTRWNLHAQLAVSRDDMTYLRLYFDGTPDIRPSPNRLLQIAAKFGHIHIAEYLICEHGADDYDLPYRIAKLWNQYDMMSYLENKMK